MYKPDLPFSLNALEPFLSSKALEMHYYNHHLAYIDKLNFLVKNTHLQNLSLWEIIKLTKQDKNQVKIYNNAAQAWNHDFFWKSITTKVKSQNIPLFINDKILEDFEEKGLNHFGSGWIWLVQKNQTIEVISTSNAEIPENCLLLCVCDVWEHAYYVDYHYKRKDYLKLFLQRINWNFVQDNLENGYYKLEL